MVVQYEICGLGGGSVSGSRDGQPGYITCPDPIEGFSCKIVTNIARKRKRCHHVPLQQQHFDTMNCNVRRPDCGVWRSPLPCALLCARHAGGTAFTQDYPSHISHTHIPHTYPTHSRVTPLPPPSPAHAVGRPEFEIPRLLSWGARPAISPSSYQMASGAQGADREAIRQAIAKCAKNGADWA